MTEMSISDSATRIEATLDEVFATAVRIGEHVSALWKASAVATSVRELESLQPAIFTELDSHAHYTGAGFLVEPGELADADRYLEWWQSDRSGGHSRLVLDLDPRRADCYDYVAMEWYVAASSGRRSVRGPYLDYAGADRFILTFATPVAVNGRFVGASGVDVLMAGFDPMLLAQMRSDDDSLALIDRDGRVIVSNSPDAAPSERLHAGAVEQAVPIGGDGIGWSLCTLR